MADENDDLLDPSEIEALLNEAAAGNPTPPADDAALSEPTPPAEESADEGPLSQEELDQIMAGAGGAAPPPAASPPPAAPTQAAPPADESVGDLLDPSEIEKLLNAGAGAAPAQPAAPVAPAAAAPTTAAPASAAPPMPAGTEELLQQAEAGLAAAISSDAGGPAGATSPFGPPQAYAFQDFGKTSVAPNDVALQTLHDVELDIRIELGRTELLIEEVLQLRDGSVLPLDKLAGDPVDVIVNDRLIARGEVLVLNDNFCVRVTEILPPHI